MTLQRFVDPGLDSGVAMFCEGRLFHAQAFRAKTITDMFELVRKFFASRGIACETVVEMPRYYGLKSKADPNDLIRLAAIAGAWRPHVIWEAPEWKGQVPKPVMHRRMLEVLDEGEQEIRRICAVRSADVQADIDDAICLGLVYLGRMKKP